MTGRRVDGYGRVLRSRPIEFVFDGRTYTGFAGDTLASALVANGVMVTGRSISHGRPRGITTAGPEEPTAVVQVESPFPEPLVPATTVELRPGLVARSLGGRGRLEAVHDRTDADAVHHHCEVLVVGGGPAGLTAALAAGRDGARVLLLDERPTPGGSMVSAAEFGWVADTLEALHDLPNVLRLQRTTVVGYYDSNYLIAIQRRTGDPGAAPAGSRERVWRIRARQVVLATGAHERHIAFAGNDVPGVMLADAARTYLHRYGVLAGSQVVLFTGHDDAYAAANDLAAAGAQVIAVDPREHGAINFVGRARTGSVVSGTTVDQDGVLDGVDVLGPDGTVDHLPADLLLVSGGWNPAAQLFSQAGGTVVHSADLDAFVPGECSQFVHLAGAVTGARSSGHCVAQGVCVGAIAREDPLGPPGPEPGMQFLTPLPGGLLDEPSPRAVLPLVLPDGIDPATLTTHYVDLQRDVTVADVVRASGAGLRSVEHVKRFTTAGTAHDQGRTTGPLVSAVLAAIQGVDIAALGLTTYRPPYAPVSFATLAGRERGDLYDPIRTTGAHSWHVAQGAVFENVGQWKRPWYYPRAVTAGSARLESMAEAVLRESTAVRSGVGFMDASTLGKIDVQGPDAGTFLDLLYTNLISTLKVGSIRYGVMCTVDGMVLDDGTVFRLAPERFLVTTTTGNAAKVLDWMEEWLQTEWPHLRVFCTSVTEQWATMAVAGPRSRGLIAALAPDLDVSNAGFPFMTWRDGRVAGLPARIARVSFSGELAFEINVAWHDAAALWTAVRRVGEPIGLTPYGTETMHVLRAEKGYPIIGQDTDGTVTPIDLGMTWAISRTKADYLGKRSHARPDTLRPDRKQLVALVPVDGSSRLPEGAQIIETPVIPAPPVPMIGHITSAYFSAALDGPFALALIEGGRGRIGSTVQVAAGYGMAPGSTIAARVLAPAVVDPQGLRRDGDPTGDGPAVETVPVAAGLPISPLSSRAAELQAFSLRPGTGLRISEIPLTTHLNLRVDRSSVGGRLICDELGVSLPTATGRTTRSEGIEILTLGPDEYLLLTGPARSADLEDRIRSATEGRPAGVTDVSAARTILRISGPNTWKLLRHGCALDLERLAAGTCHQTVLAQCAVVLVIDSRGSDGPEDAVRVLVRSSFAGHLAAWLLLTGAEY